MKNDMMREKSHFAKIVPYLITGALFFLALIVVLTAEQRAYRREVNRETASFVSAIREAYPDIPEEEIIRHLQQRVDEDAAVMQTLARFGYDDADFFAESAKGYTRVLRLTVFVWAVLFGIALFTLFQIRQYAYRRQIAFLIDYIREVSDGVYDLRIADNTEGEISRLTNEIYKIAVHLKEQAERSRTETENLSRALADISHQIRTPLTGVQATLDNLYYHPEMDMERRQAFLRRAAAQIDITNALVVTLLQLAKFDAGTVQMHRTEVPLGTMLSACVQDLSILTEIREVAVSVTGDTQATILIDEKWEREAYKNIIKNAVEHSHAGGKIAITIENTQLFCKVQVSDEGEGISQEDLKHIFERFYKSAGSDENSFGIGLSFAKTVIEADEGMITADSEVGRGTIFTIRYRKHV